MQFRGDNWVFKFCNSVSIWAYQTFSMKLFVKIVNGFSNVNFVQRYLLKHQNHIT